MIDKNELKRVALWNVELLNRNQQLQSEVDRLKEEVKSLKKLESSNNSV